MSILYFFNSNKRKNKNEQKEGFLKSMRDENCKRAAAASRRSVSLRQSPAVPFAFPMLRCTAPKEWTLHCTATTSPPWPLCCLLYCSVLACLRRDYPCGGEEKRGEETSHVSGFNLWELLLSLSYNRCLVCVNDEELWRHIISACVSGEIYSQLHYLWQTQRWQHLEESNWMFKPGIAAAHPETNIT